MYGNLATVLDKIPLKYLIKYANIILYNYSIHYKGGIAMLEGIASGGFSNQSASYAAAYQKYSANKTGEDETSIRQKIDNLTKQRENQQKKLENTTDEQEKEKLKQKIAQYDKQIQTLQTRLDNIQSSSTSAGKSAANVTKSGKNVDTFECQTCDQRKYQDDSDDSGVSFQTPTNVAPQAAESAVRGHEMEHVARNQAKADREGMKVVSQSVTINRQICTECGKSYVSGGVTRTAMKSDNSDMRFSAGLFDEESGKGKSLNAVA